MRQTSSLRNISTLLDCTFHDHIHSNILKWEDRRGVNFILFKHFGQFFSFSFSVGNGPLFIMVYIWLFGCSNNCSLNYCPRAQLFKRCLSLETCIHERNIQNKKTAFTWSNICLWQKSPRTNISWTNSSMDNCLIGQLLQHHYFLFSLFSSLHRICL